MSDSFACLPACSTSHLRGSSCRDWQSPAHHDRSTPAFPAAVSPKGDPFAATAGRRPSPVRVLMRLASSCRFGGWNTMSPSLCSALLRPDAPLSPALPGCGRRRRSAAGCPCHSSQWFCLARALCLCCTARIGRCCFYPRAQTASTVRTCKGARGKFPDRSSRCCPVSLASWRPPRVPCLPLLAGEPACSVGPALSSSRWARPSPGSETGRARTMAPPPRPRILLFRTSKNRSDDVFLRCHRQSTRQSATPNAGGVPAFPRRFQGILGVQAGQT